MARVVVWGRTHTHRTNEHEGPSFGVAVLIEIVLAQLRRWEGASTGNERDSEANSL